MTIRRLVYPNPHASAFSKARSRLWANVFDPLNAELLRLVDEHLPVWTFAAITQFKRSGQDEAVVMLPPPNRQDAVDYECPRRVSSVRLNRQVTPAGKVRVLMTSLLDSERYPATAFTDLYHGRWRIGEAFKHLKHRLNLEHTSGLSWLAACQDVGAKRVCDNLNALSAYLATEQFIAPHSPWRVNRPHREMGA